MSACGRFYMRNNGRVVLVAAPRKTVKKTVKKTATATVAQNDLFEKDLPPLTATVAQTFSSDIILSMISVAAILAGAALYIVRKANIEI